MATNLVYETGIGYGTAENFNIIIIGIDSTFEISRDTKKFEGINIITEIDSTPKIKIVFHQLTLTLLNWLKASEKQQQGVRFWNKTGEANGIYQSHFTCNEFDQTVTLFLYQKYAEPKSVPFWTGNILNLGTQLVFPFGRLDSKINQIILPLESSLIEKNVSTSIENFKSSTKGNWYKIVDQTTFSIKIYDLTTNNSPIIAKLEQIKGKMVQFWPHSDNLLVTYKNAYFDFDKKEINNRFEVNISLTLVSELKNLNFVYPPIFHKSNRTITAFENYQIYYTYSPTGQPANPNSSNWTIYNSQQLVDGNYKIIAVCGDIASEIVYEELRPVVVAELPQTVKPGIPGIWLIDGKIVMRGDDDFADVFYTFDKNGLNEVKKMKEWTKYTEPFPVFSATFQAVTRSNGKNSDIFVLHKNDVDSYIINRVSAKVATEAELNAKTFTTEELGKQNIKLKQEIDYVENYSEQLHDHAISTAETKSIELASAARIAAENKALQLSSIAKTEAISAAKTDLDNLKIGGRNYALDTKNKILNLPTGASIIEYQVSLELINNLQNKYITTTAYIEGIYTPSASTHYGIGMKLTFDDSTTQWLGLTRNHILETNPETINGVIKGAIYSRTHKVNNKKIVKISDLTIFIRDAAVVEKFIIRDIKIELGTKVTDWTLASEDITTEIITAKTAAITAAANDATSKANAAKLAAEATAAVNLNNLQIGGRNLAKLSNTKVNHSAYGLFDYPLALPIQANCDVTITLKGVLAPDRLYYSLFNSGGSVELVKLYHADKNSLGLYVKSFKWVIGSSANTFVRIYHMTHDKTSNSTIEWIKLELGTKATDWTPAPEDTIADIAIAKGEALVFTTQENAKQKAYIDQEIVYVENLAEELHSHAIATANDFTTQNRAASEANLKTDYKNRIEILNNDLVDYISDKAEDTLISAKQEAQEIVAPVVSNIEKMNRASTSTNNRLLLTNSDWRDQVTYTPLFDNMLYYSVDDKFMIAINRDVEIRSNIIFPIDPFSSYRVVIRVKKLSGNGKLYCGIETMNKNKEVMATSYGVANMINSTIGITSTHTGYFSGYNAPNEFNHNKFYEGGSFFRLILRCNVDATFPIGNSQYTYAGTIIEMIEVEKISVIRASDVITDDNRQFITQTEKNKFLLYEQKIVNLEYAVAALQQRLGFPEFQI